jgi:tetratricopeptide (TPR) repeat protein
MGIDYQIHRAAANAAKGVRQFQKADKALTNDKVDSAVNHLNKGLKDFALALDHLANAEDDAYTKAGNEIDKGNQQLSKSIDEFSAGNLESAQSHYDKALEKYDQALDLLD